MVVIPLIILLLLPLPCLASLAPVYCFPRVNPLSLMFPRVNPQSPLSHVPSSEPPLTHASTLTLTTLPLALTFSASAFASAVSTAACSLWHSRVLSIIQPTVFSFSACRIIAWHWDDGEHLGTMRNVLGRWGG